MFLLTAIRVLDLSVALGYGIPIHGVVGYLCLRELWRKIAVKYQHVSGSLLNNCKMSVVQDK